MNRQQRRRAAKDAKKRGTAGPGSTKPDLGAVFQAAINLHGAGRLDAAAALYDRILQSDPRNPDALHLKGVALAQTGAVDDGVALIRRAIGRRRDNVDYHNNLGNILWRAGRLDEAEASLRRAVAVSPGHAAAHNNLGNVLEEAGRADAALASYRRAAELDPGNAAIHGNIGILLQKAARLEEAEASLRQAVALDGASAEAHNNLGNVLKGLGRLAEAEAALRRAIALRPDYANAWHNLGGVLMDQRRLRDAVEALQRAVELDPSLAPAWTNLAAGLNLLDRAEEGATAARKAIALAPGLAEAHNNLGVALRSLGYNEAAEESYRRVVALNPAHAQAHSNLIFVLDFDPRYGVAEHQAERRRWNSQHAAPLSGEVRPHANRPDPERRLRVGYVSADFRQHSAANCFGPMILSCDRDAFDVVCYSSNFRDDAVTATFREAATLWRDSYAASDAQLAETIRDDAIDILVDLSGHTAGNRLRVFARKPAPVQVTAWGHGVGTGLGAIDYFLTDPTIVPESESALYAERIRYLPSHLPYMPPADSPPVAPPPCLSAGYPTFGSFNRLEKVNDEVLTLWRGILERLPAARLLIKSQALDRPAVRADFERRLDALGFARDRRDLHGSTPQPEHLAMHGQVDVVLDTFPHSGGVTTADALWMGVPVVTWRGRTVPWRLGASTLGALSLERFVAETPEQYVEIAVAAARDAGRLASLRASLRERMAGSPIGDTLRYCRAVEQVYREIWRRWCEVR